MNRVRQTDFIRRNDVSSFLATQSSQKNTYGSSQYVSQKPLLLNLIELTIPALETYDSSFININDAATVRIEIDNKSSAYDVYFSLLFSPNKSGSPSYIAIDRTILAGEYYSQFYPAKSDFFSYSIVNNNVVDISLNIYCSLSRFTQYETTSQLDNLVTRGDIATLTRQANDFTTDIALGKFYDYEIKDVNGYGTFDTSNNISLLWESSQNYYDLSNAETMTIYSLQDTINTRSSVINIYGIDLFGEEVSDTIILNASNSTTPIITGQTFLKVNKLEFENGENLNDSKIVCYSSSSNLLQEIIPLEACVSKTGKFALSIHKRGVLKQIFISGFVDSHDTTLTIYKNNYFTSRRKEIIRKIPIYTGTTYIENLSKLINLGEEVFCLVETKDQVDGLRNELNVTLMIDIVPN